MACFGLLLFAVVGMAVAAPEAAESPESAIVSVGFKALPGYAGDLRVGGAVVLTQASILQLQLFYTLFGLDAGCGAAFLGPRDRCAVQVRTGGCADPASAQAAGPLGSMQYFAMGDGAHASANLKTGIQADSLDYHSVVVTDSSGVPAACSPLARFFLKAEEVEVVNWQRYPGYAGDLHVAGSLYIGQLQRALDARAGQVLVLANVTGLDPRCALEAVSAPNACGVHVHEGDGCSSAERIGGHFRDEASVSQDPWAPVRYHPKMPALFTRPVVTGLELARVRGKALVVQDATCRVRGGSRRGRCQALRALSLLLAPCASEAVSARARATLAGPQWVSVAVDGSSWKPGSMAPRPVMGEQRARAHGREGRARASFALS